MTKPRRPTDREQAEARRLLAETAQQRAAAAAENAEHQPSDRPRASDGGEENPDGR